VKLSASRQASCIRQELEVFEAFSRGDAMTHHTQHLAARYFFGDAGRGTAIDNHLRNSLCFASNVVKLQQVDSLLATWARVQLEVVGYVVPSPLPGALS
jgi:hypothetical protein